MMRALVLTGIVAVAFATQNAKADIGVFLEPIVSYEATSTTIAYPSPLSNSTGSLDGFGLGARVGFHINDILFIAADGRYAKPTFKDSSNNLDSTATEYNYGPVIGLQMPFVGLRLWGGYVMGGELESGESQSVSAKFSNANGYRLGAGFHIWAFSLNIEYQSIKYGATALDQVGPFSNISAGNNISLDEHAYLASVSFPIEF